MVCYKEEEMHVAGVALWNKRWLGRQERTCSIDFETDPVYKLLEYFVPQPHSSIIEIGCGAGLRTLHFARKYNLEATLFDYSHVALERATNNARELGVPADTVNGDLLDNSLPSDCYDIVWSAGLHEHFRGEERQRTFDEMYRICKPGGVCIIIVPNSLNFPYRLTKMLKETFGTWPFGDEHPFTRWELGKRLQRSGFGGVKTVGIGALLSMYRWFLLDLGCANRLLKNPTPFSGLNCRLRNIDLDISTANHLNNIFGREVGALGIK